MADFCTSGVMTEIMAKKSDRAQSGGSREAEKTQRSCRACREPIHLKASICRHCGARQRPDRWWLFGRGLAILGAIAALSGLTKGLIDLDELLRERRAIAAEVSTLIEAANVQQGFGHYGIALGLVDQALALNSASADALVMQLRLAMAEARQLATSRGDHEPKLDRLIAVLYRGMASSDPATRADASAHAGWIEAYRKQNALAAVYFDRALQLDADNEYGLALRGGWCLAGEAFAHCPDPQVQGLAHLDQALATGHDPKFVLMIERLSIGARREPALAAAHMARSLRRWQGGRPENSTLAVELVDHFLTHFGQREGLDHLLAIMSVGELAAAFQGVVSALADRPAEDVDGDPRPGLRAALIEARLGFEADLHSTDLAALEALRFGFLDLERRSPSGVRRDRALLDELILETARVQPGTIGVKHRGLEKEELYELELKGPVQLIEAVVEGLPAAEAGLQAGDLILAVDGRAPRVFWGDPLVDFAFAGETVTVTLRRGDRPFDKTVTLAASEVGGTRAWITSSSEGVTEAVLEKRYLAHAVDKILHGGVLAVGQQISVAAAGSGPGLLVVYQRARREDALIPGDRILEVDGEPVASADALKEKLDAACEAAGLVGDAVVLRRRGEAVQEVRVPLDCNDG